MLNTRLHHRCLGRNLEVVKLVLELQHGSPMVVKLKVGIHHRCFNMKQERS